jgi:hypothetical protein
MNQLFKKFHAFNFYRNKKTYCLVLNLIANIMALYQIIVMKIMNAKNVTQFGVAKILIVLKKCLPRLVSFSSLNIVQIAQCLSKKMEDAQ